MTAGQLAKGDSKLETKFVQIHTLHSYPGVLLNRDDTGFAKTLLYGGVSRTRISSQCLKRHWRDADGTHSLAQIDGTQGSVRSRNTIDAIMKDIAGEDVVVEDIADATTDEANEVEDVVKAVSEEFNKGIYGKDGVDVTSRQTMLLGQPEIDFLRKKAERIVEEADGDAEKARAASVLLFSNKRNNEDRENLAALRNQTQMPGGLIAALFGRMVTSDPEANIDAAIHVAHAFTVHENEVDSDFFATVDDLPGKNARVAHINSVELTSGLYYGYVVVDVAALVSNTTGLRANEWLGGDKTLAGEITKSLLGLITTVSPGAKLGSTAPYSYADFALVEVGDRQPRSLAGAYRESVKPNLIASTTALADYVKSQDSMYGVEWKRRFAAVNSSVVVPGADRMNLNGIGEWIKDSIIKGSV